MLHEMVCDTRGGTLETWTVDLKDGSDLWSRKVSILLRTSISAARFSLKETVLIGDPEAVLHSDWKSVKQVFLYPSVSEF